MDLPLHVHTSRSDVRIRQFEPADEPAVTRLFDASAEWFEFITGYPPVDGDVQSLFYSLPEGAEPDDKRVLVVVPLPEEGEVIGLVEAVVRHPDPTSCAVGLFLIRPDCRRQGLRAAVADALLGLAAEEGVTLVTATNAVGWTPGDAFLRRTGFELGEQALERGGKVGNRSVGPRERPVVSARLLLRSA
ncbi:MAG: GNAT family N-acetyltransferase [Pseudonocardiaceae bacterium]